MFGFICPSFIVPPSVELGPVEQNAEDVLGSVGQYRINVLAFAPAEPFGGQVIDRKAIAYLELDELTLFSSPIVDVADVRVLGLVDAEQVAEVVAVCSTWEGTNRSRLFPVRLVLNLGPDRDRRESF
jgi:hypothetical protein